MSTITNLYVSGGDLTTQKVIPSTTGCILDTMVINHLIYTDDLLLLAPSTKGLHKLLDICYTCTNIMPLNPWSCTLILDVEILVENLH